MLTIKQNLYRLERPKGYARVNHGSAIATYTKKSGWPPHEEYRGRAARGSIVNTTVEYMP